MEPLVIISAQYSQNMFGENNSIIVEIEGQKLFVPLDPSNRHYSEIMRQVEAGELTIEEAE